MDVQQGKVFQAVYSFTGSFPIKRVRKVYCEGLFQIVSDHITQTVGYET